MANSGKNGAGYTSSFQIEDQPFFEGPIAKKPLGKVALLLQAGLVVTGLLWLGSLAAEVALTSLDETGTSAWNAAYDRKQVTNLLTTVFSGVTLGFLIWWTTWAYRNLDIAGKASENPRQVLISWFIPIMNLLIPARALEELSVGGRPDERD